VTQIDHTQPPTPPPRVVAWEATGRCNLACTFCRAEAGDAYGASPDDDADRSGPELSFDEVRDLLDQLSSWTRPPMLIVSGGEPLLRDDVFDVLLYARRNGVRAVLSTNGTTVDASIAARLATTGVPRISVSIDGANRDTHERIRGVPGCFEGALEGCRHLAEERVPFQINTTVTKQNVAELEGILGLVRTLGAAAWDVFMLVPTGRGREQDLLAPKEYGKVLTWIAQRSESPGVPIKVSCGPQYVRVISERGGTRRGYPPRGCMAADGFCFISRAGEVFPCGYLPLAAGSVRERDLLDVYIHSPLFLRLRDPSLLGGACSDCAYAASCSGCRARAYAATGDVTSEDPLCPFIGPGGASSLA